MVQQGRACREDSPEVHSNLAQAYLKLNNYASAAEEYNKALKLDPQDKQAYIIWEWRI